MPGRENESESRERGHENTSGDRQAESAPSVSDRAAPTNRDHTQFGTHGGPRHTRADKGAPDKAK